MKAILLSIKPKYVADILNGKKTIEIRKTMPKCDLPIDVYIYCSKSGKKNWHLIKVADTDTNWLGYAYDYYIGSKGYLRWCLEGKVVAKFTLNHIDKYVNGHLCYYAHYNASSCLDCEDVLEPSCLTDDELYKYAEDYSFYAWHIEDLVIFDKPKELSEFNIKTTPQSYCYIDK